MQIDYEQLDTLFKVTEYKLVEQKLKEEYKGYYKFSVEKKNGKKRWIHSPHWRVKKAQKTFLGLLPSPSIVQYSHNVVTGFVPGRSILDNARPHVGKQVVLSIDLKNFFPSFSPTEISRFCSATFGYHADNVRKLVTTTKGRLPQGAPTSPMLANWLSTSADEILVEYCTQHRLAYTRYADDLTFSSMGDIDQDVVDNLIALINSGIFGRSIKIAPNKIKFMRRHKQQRVTGIVVNEKLSIPRARRKQLRAFMHDAEVNGVKAALGRYNRNTCHAFGELSFLHLAHKELAQEYIKQFKELL